MVQFILLFVAVMQLISVGTAISKIKNSAQGVGFTVGVVFVIGYIWALTQIWSKI